MNHERNLLNIISLVICSVLLVLFILLSANSVLPLKWQFPAWRLSPHLEVLKTDTEGGTRADYVNSFGVLTVALDKNYAAVVKTLDQDGNCVLEQYYDKHRRPTISADGNYALRKEYNAEGQCITSTYLDSELHPVAGRSGYATTRRTYNAIGKVDTYMFFDADGLPVQNHIGIYGLHYEYNEDGQVSTVTSLDADGNAMNNNDHYAITRNTYAADGKLLTETFYDESGNPVSLDSGQYGYVYVNGSPICIDQNGQKMFALRPFLLRNIFAVLLIGIVLLFVILLSDRVMTWGLLLLYLAFIAYMTMINRDVGRGIITCNIPPNYYLFFMNREILSNIWLFVPFGAILYKLSHRWETIACSIVLSLLIETSQLILDIGAFEVSDLIANSLGGVIGIMVCYLFEPAVKYIWNKLRARSS